MQLSETDIFNLLNEALKRHEAGNLQEAEAIYREILQSDPQNPDALHLLGIIAIDVNQTDIAIEYIEQAISVHKSEYYYMSLAKAYSKKGFMDKTIECYKKVLEFKPDCAELYNQIGILYSDHGNINEAIEQYEKALEIKPDQGGFYYNLGNAYIYKNNMDRAIDNYKKAVELIPDYSEAYCALGTAFQYKNELNEAITYYKKAIELNPQYLNVYHYLASCFLLKGDFSEGWDIYKKFNDLKFQSKNLPQPLFDKKWDGSSLAGKTIYVYPDQGLGDTLFFARFLPVLSSLGAKVLCKPPSVLAELFRYSNLETEILDDSVNDQSVMFDVHSSMPYLPCLLNTNFDTIPFSEGYLKADPEKIEQYRENYFNNEDFKLGIVWKGSSNFANDYKRSVYLDYFYRFAKASGVKVYSLQKGEQEELLNNLPDDVEIINLGSTFNDFTDTAAAIENLDLLISIDSSVFNLAGALGKPVWTLLPFAPDWRWMLDREDSPWYNSARLFRQKESGKWADVMDRVFDAFINKLNSR